VAVNDVRKCNAGIVLPAPCRSGFYIIDLQNAGYFATISPKAPPLPEKDFLIRIPILMFMLTSLLRKS